MALLDAFWIHYFFTASWHRYSQNKAHMSDAYTCLYLLQIQIGLDENKKDFEIYVDNEPLNTTRLLEEGICSG